MSFDDGKRWERFQSNLPVSPIYDLVVKGDDIIVASHGRSFWVLDDISPLRALASADISDEVHLFEPRPARRIKVYQGWGYKPSEAVNYRYVGTAVTAYRSVKQPDGTVAERWLDAGQNPPVGVAVNYLLRTESQGVTQLIFRDAEGNEVRRFTSATQSQVTSDPAVTTSTGGEGLEGAESPAPDDEHPEPKVPVEQGLNRFIWNMRYPDARKLVGEKSFDSAPGPVALPGTYWVELIVGDQTRTTSFEIVPDPRNTATPEALREQFDLSMRIRDLLSRVHEAADNIAALVRQIDAWVVILKRREGTATHRGQESNCQRDTCWNRE